jgi:general secretion pathway protein E
MALKSIGVDPQGLEGIQIYRAVGCENCFNTGFKGRSGIFEIMALNEDMKSLILKTYDSGRIKKKAQENKMVTLRQDGILKLINGQTTIEEIFRVTQM